MGKLFVLIIFISSACSKEGVHQNTDNISIFSEGFAFTAMDCKAPDCQQGELKIENKKLHNKFFKMTQIVSDQKFLVEARCLEQGLDQACGFLSYENGNVVMSEVQSYWVSTDLGIRPYECKTCVMIVRKDGTISVDKTSLPGARLVEINPTSY